MTLEFYRNKGYKVYGKTLRERLEKMAQNWGKAAWDCQVAIESGRDISNFRKDFMEKHRAGIDAVEIILKQDDEQLPMLANALLVSFQVNYERAESGGDKDAFGYMAAEMEKALNVPED